MSCGPRIRRYSGAPESGDSGNGPYQAVPLAVGFALALVVYGVSGLGYVVAVAQMTEAGTGNADSGTTVERRASVERSETDASR